MAGNEKAKTAKQAAVEVLRRAGEPLKSDEITRRVLEVKGVRLVGKTPAASVAAMLAVDAVAHLALRRRRRASAFWRRRLTHAGRRGDGRERGERGNREPRPHRPTLSAWLRDLSLHSPSLEACI